MKIICFHNPEEEYGFLSNWYQSEFTVGDISFASMEQFMMYCKAVCFQDDAVASQILKTGDAAQIKALGRTVSGYNEHQWSGVRQITVYEGLIQKFSQNEYLRTALLNTGDAVLAECAVKDRIWGIGLSMTDAKRYDMSQWKGQNLLGYALMMAREKIRNAKN